ncbi:MAG: nuclear transport factor 2 family protein [Sneathiella sp.]|nr:nuclear transport factor 2 family protein [Sneathiella sp.]
MRKLFASIVLISAVYSAGMAEANEYTTKFAETLLISFFNTAAQTDSAAMAALLAPEFQMLFSNGLGFNYEEMLELIDNDVSLSTDFEFSEINATAADNIIVIRYSAKVNDTHSRRKTTQWAPRLTIFRNINEKWKIVAHVNLGIP